jgi:hypothetical protein
LGFFVRLFVDLTLPSFCWCNWALFLVFLGVVGLTLLGVTPSFLLGGPFLAPLNLSA